MKKKTSKDVERNIKLEDGNIFVTLMEKKPKKIKSKKKEKKDKKEEGRGKMEKKIN